MKSLTLLSFSNPNKFGLHNVLYNLKKNLQNSKFNVKLYLNKNLFKSIKFVNSSDILYFHGCWSFNYLLIFLLAKLKKKKIFFSPHGMLDPGSLNYKKFKKKFAWFIYQKYILKKSDLIIVNSQLEKKNLILLNVHKNICVIPHGIEINKFNIKSKKNSKITRIIFFSRIHPIKGLDKLLNFWVNSKLFLDPKKYQLDICGYAEDIKYLKKVKNIIFENSIKNIKIFSDKIFKKKIISKYDLLICPSLSENFSLVVLESLFVGVPVVTSVNMPWKFLENLGLGITINFEKYNESKKLLFFIKKIKTKEFKKNFKKQSNQLLKSKYNWQSISKEYNFFFTKFS